MGAPARAQDLSRFDGIARAALQHDDDAAPLYVEHHLSELSAEDLETVFGAVTAIAPAQFLAKLILRHVGLRPDESTRMAVFDYTLDHGVTQYVLAVALDETGAVAAIGMES